MTENSNIIPFVVTVETTEEGLWRDTYQATNNSTTNLSELKRFQRVCERYEILPTYLVSYPVLDNLSAVNKLASWQEQGKCEIGAQCHPWCNPPITSTSATTAQSFLCNLTKAEQFEKIEELTNRIEQRIGRRPTSFRAGRYGFDGSTAECLAELGYTVDSSVLPLFDYRQELGPDFRYHSGRHHSLNAAKFPQLIELPITTGFTLPGYRLRRWIWLTARRAPWRHFRLPGLLDRTGQAERVKLSPEGFEARQLRDLIESKLADGCRALVFNLHSNSLKKGTSPYSRDERSLDRIYDRFEKICMYVNGNRIIAATGMTEGAKRLSI